MDSNSIAARKQRWREALDFSLPSRHMFMVVHDPGAPPAPPLWPDRVPERLAWAWEGYGRARERAAWLADDTIPCLNVMTGTEIFAEAFGCRVHRPEGTNPFALPLIHSAGEVADLEVPDLGSSSLALVFEMADELHRRGGPEATMKMADIQSPMDIAALIWDKTAFYLAIVDAPEAVRELAAKVTALLTAFLDEWFRRYGPEYVAHYPAYFMPGGITLSEDEVGVVSPELFEGFFLPELVVLAERYGALGMHCCANSRHQWPGFLRIPHLKVLNLCQPVEVIREAYPFFAPHVVQMHHWYGEGDPWTWPARMPEGSRVIFEVPAETRDDALRAAERMNEVLGRA